MSTHDKTTDTDRTVSKARAPKEGHLVVAELVSDRAAAPSPFGDDQTFPLPPESLTYSRTIP